MRDSRQVRELIGMLMNPGVPVDPEDVEDWAENGPCVVRHAPIPWSQGKAAEGDEAGDTSGDGDPDGTEELADPEDDKEQSLLRGEGWKSSLDVDFHAHVTGLQSGGTGTIGDERAVRDIDSKKKLLKARLDSLKSRRSIPVKLVAETKEMLKALQKFRDEYVRAATGKDATGKGYAPHYRPFYPKKTENLVKGVRTMLLRAIETSFVSGSRASLVLLGAVNRGTRLGYTPDPRWKWQVMPFRRGSLPRLEKRDDGTNAAA